MESVCGWTEEVQTVFMNTVGGIKSAPLKDASSISITHTNEKLRKICRKEWDTEMWKEHLKRVSIFGEEIVPGDLHIYFF